MADTGVECTQEDLTQVRERIAFVATCTGGRRG
jgi:hypothetical protein